ncbi:OB-fold domain-containing protein [Sporichthya sp.]|uniref:OB-fold domain-containing protein n=1 Tax=Sporichthya sp. TaxID=65475 RepID=UPI0017A60E1A|nr:OB-fold domain-containing protein [Sporichthya sp.]MBA3741355.1 hydroxymethylglutaryl-CoA synthase family protein [Sporichthya sp.]
MRITSYGVYVPPWRIHRETIGRALGVRAGTGARAVAAHDEDTTSLGVEAARKALVGTAVRDLELWFATTAPAYADKTNAVGAHAALSLDGDCAAYDVVGSVRSGFGALRAAADAAHAGRAALAVLSDIRTGLPGSPDEVNGGDAAAAFVFSPGDPPIATQLAAASVSREFLDRWRVPGEIASHVWEERFGETAYVPLAQQAVQRALAQACLEPSAIDHLVVAGPHVRATSAVTGKLGVGMQAVVDNLADRIGVPGAAQVGVLLAAALDRAGPDQVICVLALADGADCLLLRTTDALASRAGMPTVEEQLAGWSRALSYHMFTSWRGVLRNTPPRRPDPDRPAAPPSLRSMRWKFAFEASRCTACGTRHLPPERVCMICRAIDQMTVEPLADATGVVATFTVDRLAYSAPGVPLIAAVVDFDGGGRYACELTDVDPDEIRIGMPVEMTFRRFYTVDGVHDYFWKARPLRTSRARSAAA